MVEPHAALDGVREAAAIRKHQKSSEEIAKYTVQEELPELERAVAFVRDGHPMQRLSAVTSLPHLLDKYGAEAFDALFPLLLDVLPAPGTAREVQAEAASVVAALVRSGRAVRPPSRARAVLEVSQRMLSLPPADDYLASEEWMAPLVALVPHLGEEDVPRLIAFAMDKGQVSRPPQSRLTCCAVLGAVAPRLGAAGAGGAFLDRAVALCQDTSGAVRAGMCEHLGPIARAAGLPAAERRLLPELVELLRDEELPVRLAALEAAVRLLDFCPAPLRRATFVPVLQQYCQQPPPGMLHAVARLYGEFMHALAGDLEEGGAAARVFDAFYRNLPFHPDVEPRRLCAFNFPAAVQSTGRARFGESLAGLLEQLAADPDEAVRRTLACGMHEVAALLGRERAARHLCGPVARLLRDASAPVRRAALERLDEVVRVVHAATPGEERDAALSGVLRALADLERGVGLEWRLQERLYRHLAAFTRLGLPAEDVRAAFAAPLLRAMHEGVAPVRRAASDALCALVRAHPAEYRRAELVERLVGEFARGTSHADRALFASATAPALRAAFSRRWFRANAFEPCLALAGDAVAGVRLEACAILRALKTSLELPADAEEGAALAAAVARLARDPSPCVREAAAAAAPLLERTPLRGSKLAAVASGAAEREEERQDRRKRAEEDAQLMAEGLQYEADHPAAAAPASTVRRRWSSGAAAAAAAAAASRPRGGAGVTGSAATGRRRGAAGTFAGGGGGGAGPMTAAALLALAAPHHPRQHKYHSHKGLGTTPAASATAAGSTSASFSSPSSSTSPFRPVSPPSPFHPTPPAAGRRSAAARLAAGAAGEGGGEPRRFSLPPQPKPTRGRRRSVKKAGAAAHAPAGRPVGWHSGSSSAPSSSSSSSPSSASPPPCAAVARVQGSLSRRVLHGRRSAAAKRW